MTVSVTALSFYAKELPMKLLKVCFAIKDANQTAVSFHLESLNVKEQLKVFMLKGSQVNSCKFPLLKDL